MTSFTFSLTTLTLVSLVTFANPFGDVSKELNKLGSSLNQTAEQVKTPPSPQSPPQETPTVAKPNTMETWKKRAEKAKDYKETADDAIKAHDELKAEKKARQDQPQDNKNEKLNKAKDAVSTAKKTHDVVSKAKARKAERKPASQKN